jgi:hypothetical protein
MDKDFIKDFLKKNWWLLWVVLGIAILTIIVIYFKFSNLTDKMEATIDKSNKMVVMLSPSGTVIPAKKVLISEYSKPFQKAVEKILIQNLVIDGAKATFGFTKVPKPKDIVYNYENLKNFYSKYLNKKAQIDFAKYLRTIIRLINQNNYPDFISILGSSIKSFEVNEKGFKTTILVNVIITYTDANTGKEQKNVATINIYTEGNINPKYSDFDNPFGIKLNKLKVTALKIRNGIL